MGVTTGVVTYGTLARRWRLEELEKLEKLEKLEMLEGLEGLEVLERSWVTVAEPPPTGQVGNEPVDRNNRTMLQDRWGTS